MEITRDGIACALCRTTTQERVYLVLSHQSSFPQREVIRDRWCPAGCHLAHPARWREVMPPLRSDL
ncbi:hypothetical protein OTB20_32620 [Streptomyces sp. H27-H1]|uniref:hypothetical protein n=1 Tax=unclassified Streptomyces TaxID=2593676 RepID=UPI00226FA5E1|nr:MULTISPECIES: hypothetical protein [unclassified Streptomyces]MCY0930854.1 hypothetical protein [Streptomyces sp. H27-H1]MDJ0466018.1 hypothetical protein [Streptomyces sp. H27-C3]